MSLVKIGLYTWFVSLVLSQLCIIVVIIDVVLRRLCTLRLEHRQAEEPPTRTPRANKNVAWPNKQL